MIEGIIFDLDGTLWDSTEAICKSWDIVLSKHPEINRRVTVNDLYGCMGLEIEAIGRKLFPNADAEVQQFLMNECCRLQNQYLEEHGGKLYRGLEETLAQLSKNFKLFIVSNCQDGYIQSFLKAHNMQRYFLDFECPGVTNLSKGKNNKLIMMRNHINEAVYVGDTAGDAVSAKDAEIPFIYARYGFGNVNKYDYAIDKISDLLYLECFQT